MKRFTIAACSVCLAFFLIGSLAVAQDAAQSSEEDFVKIFNGENLDGWAGDPKIWSVQDGCIVGTTGAEGDTKLTYNSFLIWNGDKELGKNEVEGNFVIRFDYRLSRAGNSGMQYRSWMHTNDPSKPYRVAGYQADFDGGNAHTGIMYGEGFRGILAQRGTKSEIGTDHKPKVLETFAKSEDLKAKIKVEDWNSYEIIAEGFTFTHKVNGEVMSVCVDNDTDVRRTKGIIAIQAHVGPPMKVEVKNLRIKML